jgi:transcriptional regulator with XRE-family HTH domain
MQAAEVAAPPGKRRTNRRVIDPAWARAARDAANLTQEDLAKRLDVGFSTVSHREGGRQKIYVETWLAILNACGLPADWMPPKA